MDDDDHNAVWTELPDADVRAYLRVRDALYSSDTLRRAHLGTLAVNANRGYSGDSDDDNENDDLCIVRRLRSNARACADTWADYAWALRPRLVSSTLSECDSDWQQAVVDAVCDVWTSVMQRCDGSDGGDDNVRALLRCVVRNSADADTTVDAAPLAPHLALTFGGTAVVALRVSTTTTTKPSKLPLLSSPPRGWCATPHGVGNNIVMAPFSAASRYNGFLRLTPGDAVLMASGSACTVGKSATALVVFAVVDVFYATPTRSGGDASCVAVSAQTAAPWDALVNDVEELMQRHARSGFGFVLDYATQPLRCEYGAVCAAAETLLLASASDSASCWRATVLPVASTCKGYGERDDDDGSRAVYALDDALVGGATERWLRHQRAVPFFSLDPVGGCRDGDHDDGVDKFGINTCLLLLPPPNVSASARKRRRSE